MTKEQMLNESSRLYKMAKTVRANNALSLDCKLRLLRRAHKLAADAKKIYAESTGN